MRRVFETGIRNQLFELRLSLFALLGGKVSFAANRNHFWRRQLIGWGRFERSNRGRGVAITQREYRLPFRQVDEMLRRAMRIKLRLRI
jgi:hypothetical protein